MKKSTQQLLSLALPLMAAAGALAATGSTQLQRAATLEGTGNSPVTSQNFNVAGIREITPQQRGFSVASPIKPKKLNTNTPLRIPGSEPAYGCMVWSDTWESSGGGGMGGIGGGGSWDFGIYSIPTNGNTTFGLQAKDQIFRASMGAVYTPKHYITAVPTQIMGVTLGMTFNIINPINWQVERTVAGDPGFNSPAMVYDPTSGVVYGFFAEPTGNWYFGTFDTEKCDYLEIAQLDNTKPQWQAMVADNSGQLYAFDIEGNLLKVDKSTGQYTIVGNMGITPQHRTSAAYNPRSGQCYYSLCSDTANALYEVDLATAAVTKVIDYLNAEEFVGMFFYLDEIAAGAPAQATSVTKDFTGASLSGNIVFDIPATTFNGNQGSGDVTYEIFANGEKVSSGTSTFGANVVAPVSVPEAGNYTFSVILANGEGKSDVSYLRTFIGEDTPAKASGLNLSYGDGKFSLSWDAAKGINGGYLNPDEISYRIKRYPGEVVVKDNYKETSLTDEMPVPDGLTTFSYTVEVLYKGTATTPASTNEIVLGNIIPPYQENFDNGDGFAKYTVINVNSDYSKWVYSSKNGCVEITAGYGQRNDNNDWLILPAVKVEKGKMYNFSFATKCRGENYPEKCLVKFGNAPTADAMTNTIVEETEVTSTEWTTLGGSFIAEETGLVYIGIQNITSVSVAYTQYVDDIAISAPVSPASPGAVTDLVVTPAADGSFSASLSFTAPTLNSDGQTLTNLDRVVIYRNDKEIASLNATPGQKLTYNDTNADGGMVNGLNTYRLVAFNSTGDGTPNTISCYIGFNTPKQVENVVAKTGSDTGKAVVTWNAVTEDINGTNLAQANVEYIVTRVENGEKIEVYKGKELTFTDDVMANNAEQTFVYYGVQAQVLDFIGEYGTSNLAPVGRPYATPFSESFKNGSLHYIWGIDATGNAAWTLLGDADVTNMTTFDRDGGMLVMTGDNVTSDDIADIFSGNISLAGVENPGLTFYVYGFNSQNKLSVIVNGGNGFEVANTITLDQYSGWTKLTVDLAQYAGKNVQIGFRGQILDNPLIAVDNIRVGALVDYDLVAGTLSGPAKVDPDKEFTLSFNYRNEGGKEADGYNVVLYRDGNAIETIAGDKLAPGTGASVEFATKIAVIDEKQSKYEVKLEWNKEQNAADNASNDLTITLRVPDYPVVTDLKAESEGNEVLLTWSDPDLSLAPDATITDDVEGYPAFSNGMPDSEIPDDSLGEWTVHDGDDTGTYSIEGYYFPNQNAKMAWMAFNPYDAGVEGLISTYSGEQMFVCFAALSGVTNDDWLISPELSGKAQTISFQAKTGAPQFGLDHYEVYYSTTGTDVKDFTRIADEANVPGKWTEFEYALPEGAKYFAIRCISNDTFALCIDDIKYAKAGAQQLDLSIVGYNIYRDGVLLNDEPVVDTSYADATLEADKEAKYVVTVVYDLGESGASNVASAMIVGIDTVSGGIDIATRGNDLIVKGAEGLDLAVYTISGIAVWNGTAETETVITLDKGVYVVTVGGKTFKVAI